MHNQLSMSYLRDATGVLLLYAVSDEGSLTYLRKWIQRIDQEVKSIVKCILVGTQCDVADSERQVTTAQGQKFADEFGMQFFEASAKLDINVDAAFFSITQDIIRQFGGAEQLKAEIAKKAKSTKKGSLQNLFSYKPLGICGSGYSPDSPDSYHIRCKLVLIGKENGGMCQLFNDRFTKNSYEPHMSICIGENYGCKELIVDGLRVQVRNRRNRNATIALV